MHKIFFTIIISLLYLNSYSQKHKQNNELIADFEYLFASLKQSSISMDIYSEEHNVNIDSIYALLKSELVENCTFNEFVKQSRILFNISADLHNGFVSSGSFSSLLPYLPDDERKASLKRIDTTQYKKADDNYLKVLSYNKSKRSCLKYIRFRYFKGKYIVLCTTIINGQEIPYGSEIIKINGQNPNEIVKNNCNRYFLLKDIVSDNYYTYNLLDNLLEERDTITISFIKPTGSVIESKITTTSQISYKSTLLTLGFVNSVFYLKDEKLLYIKYTFLGYTSKLIDAIKKYKNKDIKKVVIDVRNNGGGSDLDWINLLSFVLDTFEIKGNPKLLIKNTEEVRSQFRNMIIYDSLENNRLLEIDNDILNYIKPNKNGLKYQGNIYCVVNRNTFSSALAFSSLNQYADKFKIVGSELPYYGGFGATPMYFMLPNSKLIYRISASYDSKLFLTKRYRLFPDIFVEPNINEELDFKNKIIRRYKSKQHLIYDNPFLQTIIEQDI